MILLFTLNAWEQKLKKQIYAENEKSQSAQEQNKIVSRSLWQTVIQFVRSCTWGLFSAFITIVHQLYSVTCLPKLTQTNTTGFNSTSSWFKNTSGSKWTHVSKRMTSGQILDCYCSKSYSFLLYNLIISQVTEC